MEQTFLTLTIATCKRQTMNWITLLRVLHNKELDNITTCVSQQGTG